MNEVILVYRSFKEYTEGADVAIEKAIMGSLLDTGAHMWNRTGLREKKNNRYSQTASDNQLSASSARSSHFADRL
jgi:hypothetical protein